MSITFSLPYGTCETDHGVCRVVEHLADPDIAAYSHPGWCVECSQTGREECEICSAAVNMSNANAAQVIERLGLDFDYCGTIAAADLLGRAMLGTVGRDDSGVPSVEDRGENGARVIECGLPAGYFAARLGSLADLATLALARGVGITWG